MRRRRREQSDSLNEVGVSFPRTQYADDANNKSASRNAEFGPDVGEFACQGKLLHINAGGNRNNLLGGHAVVFDHRVADELTRGDYPVGQAGGEATRRLPAGRRLGGT